jgi:hypothetical protein
MHPKGRTDAHAGAIALLSSEPRQRGFLRLALEADGQPVLEWTNPASPPSTEIALVVDLDSLGRTPLAFYQKVGFRVRKVERSWFTPARGYPAGTLENGIPLRDLIWLDRELEQT